ncbi:MAG: HlyD family type I secretion periplasmic adaptor subunit [Methylomonas sp.]|jgi:epimerase transport system membrane fusion protein
MADKKIESPIEHADERHFRHIGVIIIFTVFGGFGLWAGLAPLSSSAIAPGVVAVESYSKTIQHLEGGIVKTIAVKDGDNVEQGEVLLILDDTQPKAQLEIMNGQYYLALAKEARLLAQQNSAAEIAYPETLLKNRDDARASEAMQVQNHTFNVQKNAFEGEIGLYKRQIEQLDARSKGLEVQRNSQNQMIQSYKEEVKDYNELVDLGYSEKQRVREFQRNLAQSEGRLGELVSGIAETRQQKAETELKILQLTKDMQRDVVKDLSEIQSELFELRERIQSLQDTVTRTIIKAPVAGMVMGLTIHTIGAVIPPGGEIMAIVPQGETLIVEAQITPMDIDRIHIGQTAEIRFSAFKTRTTPKIDGALIFISADRLVDEHSPHQEPYFLSRVAISPQGLQTLAGADLKLLPGMPAEVMIHTGQRTMLQYLAAPLKDSIAHAFTED